MTDSSGTPSKQVRKVWTLVDKVKVIDAVQAGRSNRAVAIDFNVGHTQINQIMANKESITALYTEGMNATFKYDTDVWNFFCCARSKNIPINGPMLQSEANESALKHNLNNFAASSGWLQSFCKRHQIKFSTLHGKGAQVSEEAVKQWLEELPKMIKGYAMREIYNCNETSILFKALPNKTFHGPNEAKPMGNKISNDRFSLLVCANAAGEKEKLLVIGNSKQPHSFPKYTSDLEQHVTYRSNKRGWMTMPIFTKLLNSLNNKMWQQNCNIIMFQDNCSSHPHLQLSNIKLVFYPKNTTSRLQVMDQGVITNLKENYTKRMLNVVRIEAKKA